MRQRTLDILIAAVVTAATLYPALAYRPFNLSALLLALMASVPLIWRRRAPILVALITGVATTWLSIVERLTDVPYGQLVATYTWAELASPAWRLAAIVVTAAGVTVSLAVPHQNPPSFAYVGISFITAYALGVQVRARRDRISWLEERTRRLAEEQAAAASAERARIARDMHDVLAHSVGLMVVQAEGGASVVRRDAGKAEAAFDAIAETGREALVQLRHALGVLREQEPEPAGMEAIPSLVERARRTGLDVHLERAAVPVVDATVGATAYRLVQEALTNVVKHAGAKHVAVVLAGAPDDILQVTVRDDGRGAVSARTATGSDRRTAQRASGHGLAGMRERVTAVGGRLRTGPRTDGAAGFEVAAFLPVTAADGRDTADRAPGQAAGSVTAGRTANPTTAGDGLGAAAW
ncbi:histidine kinase [Dactylosporangium sp. AC04546]|uniref:sensor histidine kinase n=1 Tax=Dactylosporangium sp. AC04546 TaxID=2862460 RepID=UPI001EE0F3FC|nr:histidine kinase [Dactylosporangium sp. AC04546]WVK87956.1 histidine kinase [Dactylosporangium sp. AC04546]